MSASGSLAAGSGPCGWTDTTGATPSGQSARGSGAAGWEAGACTGATGTAVSARARSARRTGPRWLVKTSDCPPPCCCDAADLVIAGIVQAHLPALLDGQPAAGGEIGVAQVVLPSGGGGRAEAIRPPGTGGADAFMLRPRDEHTRATQHGGQIRAQCIHALLQAVVEHVADHDHAASAPLAHAAEFRVTELRHRAPPRRRRREARSARHRRRAVALGDNVQGAAALRGQVLHGGILLGCGEAVLWCGGGGSRKQGQGSALDPPRGSGPLDPAT